MLRATLFCLTLCVLISCQKDQFDLEPSPIEVNIELDKPVLYDNLHPTILNSAWWQDLHTATRQFVAVELSQAEDPITWKQLEARMQRVTIDPLLRAQACPGFPANPEGDVTLNSQADVDAFGALKCKVITGALQILDTLGPDPICDLTPLKGIKEIGSSFSVNGDCLTNLSGLEKIKSIGELGPFGFVGVNGANLTDISALSKVSTITGSINIIDCDALTSVTSAFSNIATIASGKTAAPLTSLFVLNINDNAVLTDLSAFSGLTTIEGGLRILANGSLTDLDDFSGLNTIGEDIFLVENASLQNVDELSNISSLTDDLFVFDNASLTQCCGFYNLLCSDPPACTTVAVGGTIAFFNNGAGCTEADIVANGPCP